MVTLSAQTTTTMDLSPELIARLEKLEQKYASMGQDLVSYLDGLLYADYLTYWDYVHLDTLLSLQTPRTPFKDEPIFIMYHQITELYFKLCIHELQQIAERASDGDIVFFTQRVNRVNRYFVNLIRSFDVMVDGMEREQFLKFRMSLLPASGFQSAQYRMIEIYAAHFIHLVDKDHRARFEAGEAPISDMFEFIYWKAGATELATGNKTLTLNQFEIKYSSQLIGLAETSKTTNLAAIYDRFAGTNVNLDGLKEALRNLDVNVNVNWPLSHYKSAVRYLHKDPEDIRATGGTNWQKYLPPRFQKRIFYPHLWTHEEIENWGKAWVEEALKGF